MKKWKFLEKIQECVEEGELFIQTCSGGYYRIMLDTADGDIWLDVFVDVNSYKRYASCTVQGLARDWSLGAETEAEAYLANAIELLKDAGWEVESDAL